MVVWMVLQLRFQLQLRRSRSWREASRSRCPVLQRLLLLELQNLISLEWLVYDYERCRYRNQLMLRRYWRRYTRTEFCEEREGEEKRERELGLDRGAQATATTILTQCYASCCWHSCWHCSRSHLPSCIDRTVGRRGWESKRSDPVSHATSLSSETLTLQSPLAAVVK